MRKTLALLAFAVAFALAACDGASDSETAANAHPEADAQAAQTAPRTRAEKPGPETDAVPMAGDTAAATDPATTQASGEPKEPLRFDMTRGGEAQTAEQFEAWMDEQGVRVAEGDDAAATRSVQAGAAAESAKPGAKPQTGADPPRR